MIVLDTHAWVWLATDDRRLGKAARRKLEAGGPRGVSAMSCWELALLVAHGRLKLDRDPLSWMEAALEELRVEVVPLTPAIAALAEGLRALRDPADQVIAATALSVSAELVTADEAITRSGLVRTLW